MMMRLVVALAVLAMLSACDDRDSEQTDAVHDVQYFLDHPDEREATREQCRNNPGELGGTPNCDNASRAEREARTQERLDALDVGE